MGTVRKLPEVPRPIRAVAAITDPDYTVSFEVSAVDAAAHSAERWARATFEGSPAPLRWFLLAGWRLGLGLRLGPLSSPDHVLGWTIAGRGPDWVQLELRSWLLRGDLVFWAGASAVAMTTFVRYDRRLAAVVWPPVSIIHELVVPYVLRRAPQRLPLAG